MFALSRVDEICLQILKSLKFQPQKPSDFSVGSPLFSEIAGF